jgi:CHAD domain-containing protein
MGDKPAFCPGEPVGSALATIACDILGEAETALGQVNHDDAIAVHDFRKAMKRWRAFLRLIEPMIGMEARALRVDARDRARQLAGARDLQAKLDALSDLEKANTELSKTSFATMRDRVEAQKRAAETTALTPQLRDELAASVARAGLVVGIWSLDKIDFDDVARALASNYRRARNTIPSAWDMAPPEDLHELRQRVVEHRYQLELVQPLWPRLGKVWVAEAQRLRERLGSHQDLVMLGLATAPHQVLAPWRSRLAPLIAQRRAAHVAAARRMAERLFAERPGAFRRRIEALWDVADIASPEDRVDREAH